MTRPSPPHQPGRLSEAVSAAANAPAGYLGRRHGLSLRQRSARFLLVTLLGLLVMCGWMFAVRDHLDADQHAGPWQGGIAGGFILVAGLTACLQLVYVAGERPGPGLHPSTWLILYLPVHVAALAAAAWIVTPDADAGFDVFMDAAVFGTIGWFALPIALFVAACVVLIVFGILRYGVHTIAFANAAQSGRDRLVARVRGVTCICLGSAIVFLVLGIISGTGTRSHGTAGAAVLAAAVLLLQALGIASGPHGLFAAVVRAGYAVSLAGCCLGLVVRALDGRESSSPARR